jgi:diguanylate cyclase (GGDEF)-like protein
MDISDAGRLHRRGDAAGAPADPRATELELLNEVARIATLDLELRPMLQRITDALSRKFNWEFVALATIDDERDLFVCEAVTSIQQTAIHVGYTRALGIGVVGQVALSAQPVLVDDVHSYPNYVETMPGAQSELCVPVRHRGRTVAVLNLESTRRAAFREQLPLLTTVADQIAGAIASAHQYRELQKVNAALAETTRQLEAKTGALEEANAHLAKAVETLHRISTQDGLSGVANRRFFDETLAIEWRRAVRNGSALSLLLLDIDHFKRFNDTAGHQAGDDCLRHVAQALREMLQRATDLVARYGGEEFAILLPETDEAHARALAETIRERIAGSGLVTVSIGVIAMVPARDLAPEHLVKRADDALYEAKRLGRNRVVCAS